LAVAIAPRTSVASRSTRAKRIGDGWIVTAQLPDRAHAHVANAPARRTPSDRGALRARALACAGERCPSAGRYRLRAGAARARVASAQRFRGAADSPASRRRSIERLTPARSARVCCVMPSCSRRCRRWLTIAAKHRPTRAW
jgi:hypothetical protein